MKCTTMPLFIISHSMNVLSFYSSCDLNMYTFPYDTQTCHLDFGNVMEPTEMVNVTSNMNYVDLQSFYLSSEFEVSTLPIERFLYGVSFYGNVTCQGLFWVLPIINCLHYNDVIMGAMASQITSLAIVYSTIYSGADQRKHQSSASLAFVREFTGDRRIPRTKGQ